MVAKQSKSSYSYSSLNRNVTVTTAISLPIKPTTETPAIELRRDCEEKQIHPAPLPVYIPRPRPKMDQPGPIGVGMGPPLSIPLPPKGKKNDEFYKYWDRFTRVKEKKEGLKKGGKKVVVKGGKEEVRKAETEVGTKDEAKGRGGPSLDKDVEGRPGHPMVRSNTEGVISRYVRSFLSTRSRADERLDRNQQPRMTKPLHLAVPKSKLSDASVYVSTRNTTIAFLIYHLRIPLPPLIIRNNHIVSNLFRALVA